MKKQKGFTIIELVVVIGIIGVLALILAPTITGNKTAATATAIPKIAQSAVQNWRHFASEAGISSSIDTAAVAPALPTPAGAAEAVIFEGDVEAAYLGAYDRSGINPINSVGYNVTESAYMFSGTSIGVRFEADGRTITFLNVPKDVTVRIFQKIDSSAEVNDLVGSGKIGNIQFSCGTTANSVCATLSFSY